MTADFGKGRREEAQMIMQLLMKTVLDKPFTGVFQVPGMPPFIADAGGEATHRFLTDAICAACAAWGAEVLRCFGEGPEDEAPAEVIVICARMPITPDQYKQKAAMAAACAEVVRVLLAGAIITAKEDCVGDDQVIVVFEETPVFTDEIDMATMEVSVLARTSAKVIRKLNPGLSYIFGNEVGQSVRKLAWAIPLVELFYGPKRLRWMDLRSPGHFEHEQMMRVTG